MWTSPFCVGRLSPDNGRRWPPPDNPSRRSAGNDRGRQGRLSQRRSKRITVGLRGGLLARVLSAKPVGTNGGAFSPAQECAGSVRSRAFRVSQIVSYSSAWPTFKLLVRSNRAMNVMTRRLPRKGDHPDHDSARRGPECVGPGDHEGPCCQTTRPRPATQGQAGPEGRRREEARRCPAG